jgi:glycerol-3-phosphate cytidylyltransferase
MAIVYTGGTFDLFHSGHVNLLMRCKEIAGLEGKVVVGLNSDAFVQRFKGKKPILNELERSKILISCRYVDEVVMNLGDENSKLPIETCKANYVVIGSDWAKKDYLKQIGLTYEWLEEKNVSLCYVPYTKGISTSTIKQRLLDQK